MWVGDKSYADLMRELWGSPAIWNEKKKYVDVARRLGIDEETVRNRIKSLRESGFLLGWRLVPNPALFGYGTLFLFLDFEDQDSKEKAVPALCKMDGVVVVASIYGSSLLVTLFDDEEKSHAKSVMKIGIRAEAFTTPGMNFPSTISPKITATDWQIVKYLLKDAEKKLPEIAKEVKVSTKTVNRRLGEMMNSRAVFLMPVTNLKKAGGIAYQLIVSCNEEKRAEVNQFVSSRIENLVFRASASKSDLIFGFNGANVAEGSDLLKLVKSIPGVKSAKMNIVEHVVYVYDWLEKQVDKLIELEKMNYEGNNLELKAY